MDHFKNVGYVQYKEILLWIREAVPVRTPSNGRGVRKEIVWHNKDICTDRKTFIYKWLDGHGIKFVDDITDSRSYLLRYDFFNAKSGCTDWTTPLHEFTECDSYGVEMAINRK